jgi:hypothetical protein
MTEASQTSTESAPTNSGSAAHVLRALHAHHVQLSMMADQKANILIGAALVVLAILLGESVGESRSVALMVFTVFLLLALFCALLSVTPHLPPADVPRDKNYNPVFFGFFANLDQQEFLDDVTPLLSTEETAFRTLLVDIYQMGLVLKRKKYRYLLLSYRFVIVGLVLACIVLLAEWVMPGVFG